MIPSYTGHQMLELGRELFESLNAKQLVGNKKPVVYGAKGLPLAEIRSIEDRLGFRPPEDFVYLFQNLQDLGGVFFPWSNFDKRKYDEMIAWVLHGIEFDIDHNKFWLERWGTRPGTLSAALDIARKDFATWPKLFRCAHTAFWLLSPIGRAIPYSQSYKLTSSTMVRIWHTTSCSSS